jgi:hypothetical protein
MSDVFNHGMDAFDSTDRAGGASNQFRYNPLHYYRFVAVDEFVTETEKALLLKIKGVDCWMPKAMTKQRTKAGIYINKTMLN